MRAGGAELATADLVVVNGGFSARVKDLLPKAERHGGESIAMTEQIAMVLAVFALLLGVLWVLKKRGLASLRFALAARAPVRGAAWRYWSAFR